ncbi:MAG: 2-amino-4-hydroxy-6-hydroxymethyldihydropteridine diphosphokinase [Gammaproteobacteria bacterium]|nr:MAG: 2-amino-4-hydroxy-6-hydroxymethyldihydropteridine diphosphokinase [Gammaproteobacteria bacterium]
MGTSELKNMNIYIALGSNLKNPEKQIIKALQDIAKIKDFAMIDYSSLYQSRPLDNMAQPDYINSVCQIKTNLEPFALLAVLQQMEQTAGREQNKKKWSSRILDLDILLIDNKQINDKNLIVPHNQMLQRNFVIIPLYEIAPNLTIKLCKKQLLLKPLALKLMKSPNRCKRLYRPTI